MQPSFQPSFAHLLVQKEMDGSLWPPVDSEVWQNVDAAHEWNKDTVRRARLSDTGRGSRFLILLPDTDVGEFRVDDVNMIVRSRMSRVFEVLGFDVFPTWVDVCFVFSDNIKRVWEVMLSERPNELGATAFPH
eukprot:3931648-Rhodomonas_salina.1